MPKKCCVKNCQATGQSMHRFPNPNKDMNLFFQWLKILGPEQFHFKTPQQIYNNQRVCFAHFLPSCKSPGHRTLHRYAIPTIGIPGAETPVSSSTSSTTETSTGELTESQN